MKTGELVVATLREPREQFWGLLGKVDAAGVTIRGIDVRNFEEWSRQIATPGPQELGPQTVFFPSHRLEKLSQDEPVGVVPSLDDRFQEITDKNVRQFFSF